MSDKSELIKALMWVAKTGQCPKYEEPKFAEANLGCGSCILRRSYGKYRCLVVGKGRDSTDVAKQLLNETLEELIVGDSDQ